MYKTVSMEGSSPHFYSLGDPFPLPHAYKPVESTYDIDVIDSVTCLQLKLSRVEEVTLQNVLPVEICDLGHTIRRFALGDLLLDERHVLWAMTHDAKKIRDLINARYNTAPPPNNWRLFYKVFKNGKNKAPYLTSSRDHIFKNIISNIANSCYNQGI